MKSWRWFVLLILLVTGVARADELAAAVSLFDEGNRLYEAGKYADACRKYEASLQLDAASLDTRGRLALCYERIDRLASAWSAWREVRAGARRSGRKRAEGIAASHIAQLEPRLTRLTLELGVETTGVSLNVTLDGTTIPVESFGTPVAVDKGGHEIQASAPGRLAWSTVVTVDNGETRTIRVQIGPVAEEPPPSAPAIVSEPPVAPRPAPSSAQRWIGLALTGAGVTALGVGTWAGIDARDKRDQARKLGCFDDFSSCPMGEAFETAEASWARAKLSTGFVVAGTALVATGVVLWLTAPSATVPERHAWRVAPQIGSSHAGVVFAGSF